MDFIFQTEEKPSDRLALKSDQGLCVTYGDLTREIALLGELYGERCLIFCMCRNEPGAVVGYVAAVENGMVPLLLDADLKKEQLDSFLNAYQPAYIWAPENWDGIDGGSEVVYGAYGYCLLRTGCENCPLYPELGLLLATSGSTGDPRLVRISRENIRANTEAICRYLHLNERERPITTLPMQYTYGLSIIQTHLFVGACILMTTASYVQTAFWDFLEREQATSFGGVPYTYEILKKLHVFQKKLPSVRTLTQAGGKLTVSLQREIVAWTKEQGIDFYIMYGQTEATARMSYLPPARCREKEGSIGVPIPGGRFRLVDEKGKDIREPDVSGELIYEGPNVTLGMARCRADLAKGDERQGVLHTGDLARRDAEGFFYIVGRMKRFVKIYGTRVGLDECEEILRKRHPECEIACGGSDDCLKVYVSGSGKADFAGELADYLRLNRRGFTCISVRKIPRNAAGKILYGELEQ